MSKIDPSGGDGVREALSHLRGSRAAVFFSSILAGLGAGVVVTGFRFLLDLADRGRRALFAGLSAADNASVPVVAALVLFVVAIGLLLGWAGKRRPMIRGSGIPQLKGALMRKLDMSWWPELPMKLAGGVLALGAGLSLGREGPSVQLGAYAAQAGASFLKRPELERKYLVTAGAAAGLSAAFNAPLAGVMFALEELHRHFSPLLVACAMAASVVGDFVAAGIFGLGPVFDFKAIAPLPAPLLPAMVALGLVCTIVGELFKRSLYFSQDLYAKARIPELVRPVVPLLAALPLGFFMIDVTGGGHALIESIAHASPSLGAVAALLAAKLAFTALSYGSGAPGGIFLPLLACGALLGSLFGGTMSAIGLATETSRLNFIVLGMAGLFSAVVRAPLTGAILILEMSGNLNHFAGLIACTLSAYAFGALLKSEPVYEVLLDRILAKGAGAVRAPKSGKALLHVPVFEGSSLAHMAAGDIPMPPGAVLVAVERGEDELVAQRGLAIATGDRLVVLCDEGAARDAEEKLVALGGGA